MIPDCKYPANTQATEIPWLKYLRERDSVPNNRKSARRSSGRLQTKEMQREFDYSLVRNRRRIANATSASTVPKRTIDVGSGIAASGANVSNSTVYFPDPSVVSSWAPMVNNGAFVRIKTVKAV